VVAIDEHKEVFASISGHGKPTSKRILKSLENHIEPGSTIVHDGERSHNLLIKTLGCKSEVYIADLEDPKYLSQMKLINNLCSWIKRYIYRFIGMRKVNLQSYLNWFVYLFRGKAADDTWPAVPRILRHLVLTDTTRKRRNK
jgi:hypothetical protein